ncbi:site-specific integrase [Pseudoalteromonas denitrificans]|uniref:Phage integrase family protein n=1 Tax=Pseudoalteromonas denitrificans DSM 6059 TaxID=1123010 RepID=A0A1I1PKC8_9GAMM|nr:site-specific integrase [Pseudoalteromonas denitrificans]SFD10097.1 hypothetical protein SAMN02745724_03491 [Pseudoalteromonas denitrificans DSM 6059]
MVIQTHTSPVTITDNDDSLRQRGLQQWQLLDAIVLEYRDKKMSFLREVVDDQSGVERSPKFMDDIWYLKEPGSGKTSINFSDWFPKREQFPLAILMRVLFYEMNEQCKLSCSTIRSHMGVFLSYLVNHEMCSDIFTAFRNQPFSTFLMLDTYLVNMIIQLGVNRSVLGTKQVCNFLKNISVLKLSDAAAYLTKGLQLPWLNEGITIEEYVNRNATAEKIAKTEGYYPPIPFETVSHIVKHTTPFVELHFESLCEFFTELRQQYEKCERWDYYCKSKIFTEFVLQYQTTIEYFLPIKFAYASAKGVRYVMTSCLTELMTLAKSSCAWIILLTTGLRNIDMRKLRIGCSKQSKKDKSIYWLLCYMEKTKLTDVLPIPEITHKAIKLLECLRWDSDSTALVTTHLKQDRKDTRVLESHEIGMLKSGASFNKLLKALPNHYEFSIANVEDEDSEATAHCIRTTLAGYIGEHSSAAILLLKKLFGHSNALMPEQYLRNNKLIQNRRKKLIIEHTKTLAKKITSNVINGTVGGQAGDNMKANVERFREGIKEETQLKNESLNEVQLMQKLEQRLFGIIYGYIHDEQIHAFITPMSVVCMRATSDGSDSPCAAHKNHQDRKASNIKKSITDALANLPDPSNCVGIKCADALMLADVSEPILKSFEFYLKVTKSDDNSPQVLKEQAEMFVHVYKEPLIQVFNERMMELLDA